MALSILRNVLSELTMTRAWMVLLVKIKNTKIDGTTYATRGISLSPEGTLTRFISNLSKIYTDGNNANLNKYESVIEYDGTAEATKIYKLKSSSELIADEYGRLIHALSAPEMTGDPLEFSANAYALKSTMEIEGEEKSVILFSLQNPISILKNRFLFDEGTFFELNKKVLNLRQKIDVIIIGNDVYLLNLAGENLFNMERSYKAISDVKAADICESGIISNSEVFKQVATSGHNPRRFVAFNQNRYESMKNLDVRKKMAETFQLSLNSEGEIDTESKATAEKLVKLLCNKGMLDPFENVPVEVSRASRW